MTFENFKNKVTNNYHKYFTDSQIMISQTKILSITDINIRCFLSTDETECSGRIRLNDMFSISLKISLPDLCEELPENLTLEYNYKSYLTKPTDKYCVYGRRHLKTRKTKGTPEKIIKDIDKFFNNLYSCLLEDINNNNIHENHITLLNQKIIK